MSIKDMVLRIRGLEPRRHTPGAAVLDGARTDPGELTSLAARTQEALRQPVPPAQPGLPLVGFTTDDLNNGVLRKDYLERRARRESDRRARAQAGAELNVLDFDIKPRP